MHTLEIWNEHLQAKNLLHLFFHKLVENTFYGNIKLAPTM